MMIKIQKRAIKFWKHLKSSDPHSHHFKALQYQELSKDTCPLTQLVLSLSSPDPHTHTNTLLTPQDQYRKAPEIRINQIGKTIKQNAITNWKTKTQSKMQFYLALNRNYTLAPYLTPIRDKNLRTTLTKYSLLAAQGKQTMPRLRTRSIRDRASLPDTNMRTLDKTILKRLVRSSLSSCWRAVRRGFHTSLEKMRNASSSLHNM